MSKLKAPSLGDVVWYFPHLSSLHDEGKPVGPFPGEVKGVRRTDDGRVLVDLDMSHSDIATAVGNEVVNIEWREHAPKDHGQADIAAPVKQ